MDIIRLSQSDFERFRELQRRRRWDWPAVFSSNCEGHIWAFVTRGWTKLEKRTELRGVSDVLDKVAAKLELVRSERGRFFIDESGAFFKDELGAKIQFVQFVWEERR